MIIILYMSTGDDHILCNELENKLLFRFNIDVFIEKLCEQFKVKVQVEVPLLDQPGDVDAQEAEDVAAEVTQKVLVRQHQDRLVVVDAQLVDEVVAGYLHHPIHLLAQENKTNRVI